MNWLHTDGTLIKDSYGGVVRPNGVNIPWLDQTINYWKLDLMKTVAPLRPRMLRLNIGTDNWPTYEAEIDEIIQWCKANGIYVLWDCHFIGLSSAPRPKNVWEDPVLKQWWLEWLGAVAEKYKNEPTVCGIGLLNEPGWALLNTEVKFQQWIDTATEAVDYLRAINPHLLFFIAGRGAALWDGYWNTKPFIDRPNCVFEGHLYPGPLGMYSEFLAGTYQFIQRYIDGELEQGYIEMSDYLINSRDRIYGILEGLPIHIGEVGLEYLRDQKGNTFPEPYHPFPNALKMTEDFLRFLYEHNISFSGFAYDHPPVWGLVNENGTPRPLATLMSQYFIPTPNLMKFIKNLVVHIGGPVATGLYLTKDYLFKRRG